MTKNTLVRILDPETPGSIFWAAKSWNLEYHASDICADIDLLRSLFRLLGKLRIIPLGMCITAALIFSAAVHFQFTKGDLLRDGTISYTYILATLPLIVFLAFGGLYSYQMVESIRSQLAGSPHVVRLEAFFKDLSELSVRINLEERIISSGMSEYGSPTIRNIVKATLVGMAGEVLALEPDKDTAHDVMIKMEGEQNAKRIAFEHFFDLAKRFSLLPAKATYDAYYLAATSKVTTNAKDDKKGAQ